MIETVPPVVYASRDAGAIFTETLMLWGKSPQLLDLANVDACLGLRWQPTDFDRNDITRIGLVSFWRRILMASSNLGEHYAASSFQQTFAEAAAEVLGFSYGRNARGVPTVLMDFGSMLRVVRTCGAERVFPPVLRRAAEKMDKQHKVLLEALAKQRQSRKSKEAEALQRLAELEAREVAVRGNARALRIEQATPFTWGTPLTQMAEPMLQPATLMPPPNQPARRRQR